MVVGFYNSELSDKELIALANSGDKGGFDGLYLRYRDWGMSVAKRFLRDESAIADVVQDAFIYFLKQFPGFVLKASLKTYLYTLIKHRTIDHLRKLNHLKFDTQPELTLQNLTGKSGYSEASQDLFKVLSVLESHHLEVILLKFIDGLTLEEISQTLEIPLGTVKSRQHKALKILRLDENTKKYFLP